MISLTKFETNNEIKAFKIIFYLSWMYPDKFISLKTDPIVEVNEFISNQSINMIKFIKICN